MTKLARVLAVGVALLAGVACKGQATGGTATVPCQTISDCPCQDTSECPSGLECLDWLGQGYCLEPCASGCRTGWRCEGLLNDAGAIELGCLPEARGLCAACVSDDECGTSSDGCVAISDGTFCGRDCSTADCPSGYACEEIVTVAGVPGQQCVPTTHACGCRPGTEGYVRSCTRDNMYGSCAGVEQCDGEGVWAPCTASVPRQESCNGLDDDCDGLVDNYDPSLAPPEGAHDFPQCHNGPSCAGEYRCVDDDGSGTPGWICTAAPGILEVCNGQDDDCDGVADNGFVDGAGRYIDVADCGACNQSCLSGVANLAVDGAGAVAPDAVSCELLGGVPTCVVRRCLPGFVPYPPGDSPEVCLPVGSSSCAPCLTALDCASPTDLCVAVGQDDSDTCALDCSATSPHVGGAPCDGQIGGQGCCPDGFTCTAVEQSLVCLPESGTCQCASASVGLTRPCRKTGAGGTTCIGYQQCDEVTPGVFGFTTCDASTTTHELCNGIDDDCDRAIDEEFIGQHGTLTYDTDQHCGDCATNCQDRWNPAAHHVVGRCATSPAPHCSFDPADCLLEPGPGGRSCDVGCPPGEVCLTRALPGIRYDYYQCGRVCQAAGDCGGGYACVEGACEANCTVGAAGDTFCTATHGPLSRCVTGHCQVMYQWADRDHRQVTGCECPAPTLLGADEPATFVTYPSGGELYLDTDCDGIDGHAAAAVFVSAANQGAADGTLARPFRTISAGLAALAGDPSKRYVLVATGLYRENLTLAPKTRLYGGYSTDFVWRDIVQFATTIAGVEPDWIDAGHPLGTITARCDDPGWAGGELVEVSGFTIYGFNVAYLPPAGQAGKSSYAVYLRECHSNVRVVDNVIIAGQGGLGGSGVDGAAGATGGNGRPGLDAQPCCSSGQCPTCGGTLAGGAAGANATCVAANGAAGDTSTSGDTKRGDYSCGSSYCALNCRYDCTTSGSTNGANGGDGSDGTTPGGAGGAACSVAGGSVVGGVWVGGGGGVGSSGTAATGGQGGIAGPWVGYGDHSNPPGPTGCLPANLYKVGDFGGTGGGGGAGGCGGSGGSGGSGGGGSFALFVVLTAPANYPQILGNRIERGSGGAGGTGGYAGPGGEGGLGGLGGIALNPSWCAGLGGNGGRGGVGGSGGGGGGGCGGVAYAIGGRNIAAAGYQTANTLLGSSTGGAGGLGGGSPAGIGARGAVGANGSAGDFISLP